METNINRPRRWPWNRTPPAPPAADQHLPADAIPDILEKLALEGRAPSQPVLDGPRHGEQLL
ncbi:hypothetical protein [Actinoplanes sp. NBRC 101535]|uniref:hypothetical protein n=1 Tax=Actinoplanes sp. NBRC 101535 TaxID=3032196 RepID=UPI0024A5629E|nr:hypothetical protein [Actinoplanes sp. NBRC 101535]GLY08202.1 hypothetical protein Acsp01_85810 [Actinoplanes sp. NBRC 101535]